MAVNDGIGNPVRDPFPGVRAAGDLPYGSAGTRTPGVAADLAGMESGLPNSGIPLLLTDQLDDAGAASTTQPGQMDEGVSGLGADFTATSGAGHGKAGHYRRFGWQQPDGP